jgi:SAM-dependent methyltransferase
MPKPSRGPARRSGRAKKPTLAETSDRHALYERAVQCAEAEVSFVNRVYTRLRGRPPRRLREDFCGTAAVCCEWVRKNPRNSAVGLDLDQPTLDWGREHNLAKLSPAQAARVELLRRDVLAPGDAIGMDAILAMNFSYWIFKERETLRRYFASVRRSLASKGIFCLDIYGGWEILKEQKDRRQIGTKRSGFLYVWDQALTDPISHETLCHIHFRLRDGSWMRKAFTYDWRAWTIPEVRELLAEAGFKRSTVYWEGDDDDGGGNGIFRPVKRAENCPSFIAYIVAEP